MTELKEVFEKAFPFWDSLTEEEQTEMILGTTKNVCKKKTKLHFGGESAPAFRSSKKEGQGSSSRRPTGETSRCSGWWTEM